MTEDPGGDKILGNKPVIKGLKSLSGARPADAAPRLATLPHLAALDAAAKAALEDFARLASHACRAPIAIVELLGDGGQSFRATVGLSAGAPADASAVLAHAIRAPGFLEVPDMTEDARFSAHPLVAGPPHLRFLAVTPLETTESQVLGMIAVLDTRPRRLDDADGAALLALARRATAALELRRAVRIADRLRRHRNRRIEDAAHDLKQPLATMIMILDRLRRTATDAKIEERLAAATGAGLRLGEGLDRLATGHRAEDDDESPVPRAFAVEECLSQVAVLWRPRARAKGLELRMVRSSARIVSDPAMLAAILGHLIAHAIRFTESGAVLVGCRRRGRLLSIAVLDTGPGIPEGDLPAIFDAFRETDPSAAGAGLGLWTAERTADLLGHAMRASAGPEGGARFSVEVPLAD